MSFGTSKALIMSIFTLLFLSAFLYVVILSVYRLYLCPSSKFPGPKLAALTYWYEFYYDVWQEGQYTWKIRDLHSKYGNELLKKGWVAYDRWS